MKNKFGFSLLELAVSMTMISLIAGVILASTSLYNQSQLRSVIKEIQMLNNAITIFKDRYGYFPGDFLNTPSNWSARNGDGDGSIYYSLESSNVWHHLYSANLINQPFVASNSGSVYYYYKSIYGNNAYIDFRMNQAFNVSSNMLELGALSTAYPGQASYGILKPKDAYYIDSKIDDGIANYGILLGVDGDDASTGQCSANYSNTSTSIINYNLNNKIVACKSLYIGNPLFSN